MRIIPGEGMNVRRKIVVVAMALLITFFSVQVIMATSISIGAQIGSGPSIIHTYQVSNIHVAHTVTTLPNGLIDVGGLYVEPGENGAETKIQIIRFITTADGKTDGLSEFISITELGKIPCGRPELKYSVDTENELILTKTNGDNIQVAQDSSGNYKIENKDTKIKSIDAGDYVLVSGKRMSDGRIEVNTSDVGRTEESKPVETAKIPPSVNSEVIKISAPEKLLEEIKSWNKRICFYTSKDNPISSIEKLEDDDIAAWDLRLLTQVSKFREIVTGTTGIERIRMIGTGNPIFNGMDNPPRIFVTWNTSGETMKGAVQIEFVKPIPKTASPQPLNIKNKKSDSPQDQAYDLLKEPLDKIANSTSFLDPKMGDAARELQKLQNDLLSEQKASEELHKQLKSRSAIVKWIAIPFGLFLFIFLFFKYRKSVGDKKPKIDAPKSAHQKSVGDKKPKIDAPKLAPNKMTAAEKNADINIASCTDDQFLTAPAIERNRMALLWTDADQLEALDMVVGIGGPILLPDENGNPQKLDVTKEDVSWAKKVDLIAAKAAEASNRGDYEKSITFYKNALELAPGADIYLMSIGACYAKLGNNQKAQAYLNRAHEISPQNKRIKTNLEALHSKPGVKVAPAETELLPWKSIRNAWLIGDREAILKLQGLSRNEIMALATTIAQQLADDVFPSIKKWMDANKSGISILLLEPLVKEKIVPFVRNCAQPDPLSKRLLKECNEFMLRTGSVPSGGKVAIVIGLAVK